MKITIGWLYPKLMNLYGDRGNIIALAYRCKKRNINFEIKNIEIGDNPNSSNIDMLFFGGGQDKEQIIISDDLLKRKDEVFKFYQENKPMLAICGGFQLLGKYFLTANGKKIPGLGILNFYTKAGEERMIGNIKIYSKLINDLIIGFENHSGETYIGDKNKKLGEVIKGYGNNGVDKTEGIIDKNFIGTYLHGPILPKNPKLTDWFIKKALEIKYSEKINLKILDDTLEQKAKYILNK